MGFQIKNKEGQAIAINELDREAAAFWGKETDPKWYATPDAEGTGANWFDMIGRAITDPDNYRTGYTNYNDPYTEMDWVEVAIRMTLCNISGMLVKGTKPEGSTRYMMTINDEDRVLGKALAIRKFAMPFFNLIKHWEEKGYTPHRVE